MIDPASADWVLVIPSRRKIVNDEEGERVEYNDDWRSGVQLFYQGKEVDFSCLEIKLDPMMGHPDIHLT